MRTTTVVPVDQAARTAAVESHTSLIVQAPAGSGKTSLLVQRFLRLLPTVAQPESILAITFTRKAAAEMRTRIVDALRTAATAPCPEAAHEAYSWRLARAAYEHAQAHDWALLDNTGRLRVQTIDSLCADLARRVPLISDMGALPEVSEDATDLYRQAAEAALDPGDPISGEHVTVLAEHLDGNFETLAALLITMLQKREQWQGYLGASARAPRELLEAAIAQFIDEAVRTVRDAIPATLAAALAQAAAHSAYFVEHRTFDPDMATPASPDADAGAWQAIARFVLTSGKPIKLRSAFTKRDGVPTPKDLPPELKQFAEDHKANVLRLRDELRELPRAQSALVDILALPKPRYSDDEWQVLSAVVAVLQRAVAELRLVFAAHGTVDFAEIQQRALHALREPGGPSELALMMDYQLAHLLVDEFQDTSLAQVELLRTLTEGWQPDDGRTLFLVGDPMQSIYRFRQAEVGNFLRAQQDGIGALTLEPLELQTNFRSTSNIVAWTNDAFAQIFPARDDIDKGEVQFKCAEAAAQIPAAPAVQVHAQVLPDGQHPRDSGQSERVATLIARKLADDPQGTVAILVRARKHLDEILPALSKHGVAFQAVDLEPLHANQLIQDVHALTRMLLHPGDRIAWMTVLRAPWCGLTLTDLTVLLQPGDAFWVQRIVHGAQDVALSEDGRARLLHVSQCYSRAAQALRRDSLRSVVNTLWQELGGVLCAGSEAALRNVRTYFEALSASERAGTLTDLPEFERKLEKLYAAPEPHAGNCVQVMTMHKAKGLEFDTVIIPGLERIPNQNKPALLNWRERLTASGRSSLLMAPIARDHHDHGGLYPLIQSHLSALTDAETVRLMYVAATRARKELHLFGCVTWDDKKDELRTPQARTLLGRLWPVVAQAFEEQGAPPQVTDRVVAAAQPPLLERLPRTALDAHQDTLTSAPASAVTPASPGIGSAPDAEDELSSHSIEAAPDLGAFAIDGSQTPRHIGTLVHRWLDRIASAGVEQWNAPRIAELATSIEVALANLGVAQNELSGATAQVMAALENVLADEQGRWVLTQHPHAECELALTMRHAAGIANFVLDRTFVVDGVRWIIDYKVSAPLATEQADVDAFIAAESEKYAPQLHNYARLMAHMGPQPIRVALYFPLLQRLHSWAVP